MKTNKLKEIVLSIYNDIKEEESETEKLLNMKIKNPETDKDIKLKSALSYPDDSKVYKAAKTAYAKGAEILGVSADPKKSAQEPEADPKKSAQEPEADPKKSAQEPEAEPKADASNSDVKKPKIPQNKEEAQKLYIGHVEGDFDRETLTGWSDEFSNTIAKGKYPNAASTMWHTAVTGADGGKATEGMDMEPAMQVVANSLNSGNLESVAQIIAKFVPNKNTYVGDARGYDGKLEKETKEHINKIIDMAGGADKVKQIVQTQQDTARGMIDQMKSGELDLVGDGRASWQDDDDDDYEPFNKEQAMKDLKRLESDAKKFLSVMDKELGLAGSDAERKSAADKKSAEKASFEKSASDAKKAPAKATKELTIDDAKKLGFGKGYDEKGVYHDMAQETYDNLPQDTAQISDDSTEAYNRGKDFNLVDAVLGWGDSPNLKEFEPEDQEKAKNLASIAMNSGDFGQVQGFMYDGGPEGEGLENLVDATGGPDKTKQIAQNHIKSIQDMIKKAESGELPLHDDPDAERLYPDDYWDEDKRGKPTGQTHQETAIESLNDCLNDTKMFADNLEKKFPGSEAESAKKKKASEDKAAAWKKSPERKKIKDAYDAEVQPLKDEQDKLMKTVLALKKQQKENPSDETKEKLEKARKIRRNQETQYLKKKSEASSKYNADLEKAYAEFEPPTNEGYIKLADLIRM